MKRIIFATLALCAAICSCTKTEDSATDINNAEGGVNFRLSLSDRMKGSVSDEELLENSLVNIYYADFSGLVRTYLYKDMPAMIYLPCASYRVDVIAGEAAKETFDRFSWDSRSYKGSTPFSVSEGSTGSVTVEAGISNAVTKVSFDGSVDENFAPGYTLKITLAEGAEAVYDRSRDGKEGYFILSGIDEPVLNWEFKGTLLKNGEAFAKSGVIEELKSGALYDLGIKYTVKDGEASFEVNVDYDTEIISDIVVFEATSTGPIPSAPYEIWAGHAKVHANVDEEEFKDPSAVKFEYSEDGSSWTEQAADRTAAGVYEAVITGLKPSTEYSYRLAIAGEQKGETATFTTESAEPLPNASFEETSTSASGNFKEFYNPSAENPADRTPWWGSGNGSKGIDGSADFGGYVICAPDTADKVDGRQSAKLTSLWCVIKFAAGNLFTGYFGGLIGTEGGKVYFGRYFHSRPTALKLYVKYSTGKVNHINSYPAGDPVTTDDYDRGKIFVAVGNWNYRTYKGTQESPILVNTTVKSTLYDYKNIDGTIGYGELILKGDSSNSYNKWVEYTIPIEYNDERVTPTHIIIQAASSMLGDYFTGSDKSIMWLDKAELLYE